jgi:hypothetical protein
MTVSRVLHSVAEGVLHSVAEKVAGWTSGRNQGLPAGQKP